VKNITADALPTSFRIVPVRAEQTNAIQRRFETQPGVEDVATPEEALRGLLDATNTARIIFIGLSLVLLVSSLFLIVNTIRLATFARRREIEVMKLVGATNWFVRGPFMLEGLICGAAGSITAVVMLLLGKELVLPTILPHINAGTDVQAISFGLNALILIGAGLLLGAAGSGLTLRRFLKV
jgi:cell division transport system permease protein